MKLHQVIIITKIHTALMKASFLKKVHELREFISEDQLNIDKNFFASVGNQV